MAIEEIDLTGFTNTISNLLTNEVVISILIVIIIFIVIIVKFSKDLEFEYNP